jgi:replication factor C subunit 3/5
MLLIDKYKTNTLMPSYDIIHKLLYSLNTHNNIYDNIDMIVNKNNDEFKTIIDKMEHGEWKYANLPHLLFYGPDGCGKEFIVDILLEKIFTKKSTVLQETEYTINGYGNSKTKVMIKQSQHHIMIEPNNNGFDKYLIQEIIEDYAKSEIIQVLRYKRLYKIVIINLIDNLSYYAQASLRRTMEKYANTCKFIFISNQLSKVHEPLKSRCMMIRIPAPTDNMIMSTIMNIAIKEKIKITGKNIMDIISYSKNNINKAIGMLELISYNISLDGMWYKVVEMLVDMITDTKQYNKNGLGDMIENARLMLYQLFITNIDFHTVIKTIMIEIKKRISDNKFIYSIICETSKFENRICQGTRHIIHLEAYIIKLIDLYYKNIVINKII